MTVPGHFVHSNSLIKLHNPPVLAVVLPKREVVPEAAVEVPPNKLLDVTVFPNKDIALATFNSKVRSILVRE